MSPSGGYFILRRTRIRRPENGSRLDGMARSSAADVVRKRLVKPQDIPRRDVVFRRAHCALARAGLIAYD